MAGHQNGVALSLSETLTGLLYRLGRELRVRLAKVPNAAPVHLQLDNRATHVRITFTSDHDAALTLSPQANDELARLRSEIEALGGHVRLQTAPNETCITLDVDRSPPAPDPSASAPTDNSSACRHSTGERASPEVASSHAASRACST